MHIVDILQPDISSGRIRHIINLTQFSSNLIFISCIALPSKVKCAIIT